MFRPRAEAAFPPSRVGAGNRPFPLGLFVLARWHVRCIDADAVYQQGGSMLRRGLSWFGLCLVLVLAAPAFGVTITLEVNDAAVGLPAGASTYDPETDVTHWYLTDSQGDVSASNPWGGAGLGVVVTEMEAWLKEDPFVTNNITVINPTPVAQT